MIILERVAIFVVLALLWENAVDIFKIKPYLLPPLSKVIDTVWLNRAMLLDQSLITVLEIVLGYGAAVFGGVVIALLISAWPIVQRTFYSPLVLFQGLPKIALAPLMVIWVGYGTASKVLMAFLFAFFPAGNLNAGRIGRNPAELGGALSGYQGVTVDDVLATAVPRCSPGYHRRLQDRDATRRNRCDRWRIRWLRTGTRLSHP